MQTSPPAFPRETASSSPALFLSAPYLEPLYDPPPTSFVLSAALLLLQHPTQSLGNVGIGGNDGGHSEGGGGGGHAYLLPTSYLRRWVRWAANQPVPSLEAGRVRTALRMAASMYGIGGLGASGAMKDGGRKAGRSPSPQSVARHGKGGGLAPPAGPGSVRSQGSARSVTFSDVEATPFKEGSSSGSESGGSHLEAASRHLFPRPAANTGSKSLAIGPARRP